MLDWSWFVYDYFALCAYLFYDYNWDIIVVSYKYELSFPFCAYLNCNYNLEIIVENSPALI